MNKVEHPNKQEKFPIKILTLRRDAVVKNYNISITFTLKQNSSSGCC